MTNPLSVLCPVCLASPGKPCRSIVPWMQGIEHGKGSKCGFHPSRVEKAGTASFRIIPGGKSGGPDAH